MENTIEILETTAASNETQEVNIASDSENATQEVLSANESKDNVIPNNIAENEVKTKDDPNTEVDSLGNGANNSIEPESLINDEKVIEYLKGKGIEIDSLNVIKSTQQDKDIQLFKKYKEITNNGNIEDFIYAKEIAQKNWEEVNKSDLVARYLSEVETLQDSHVTRKLRKLAPEPILSQDDFYASDYNGDYNDYVESVKDGNIDKEIEFSLLYKQSINHYKSESEKYKDLFNSEFSNKKDTLDEYYVGLAKAIDSVQDVVINDTKIVYTKEEKDFMLSAAQQINNLPSKYFNQDGTAKDSKKLLQDFAWLDAGFRERKLKQAWQVAFNTGKEAMIKQKANITLDTNSQSPVGNVGLSFEDVIKKSLTNF